jgi:cation:H+ antiporter
MPQILTALFALLAGFVLLIWSADRFVEGAAATADHAGMPPLLIGMVVVGFGTSAPELAVSALAALGGTPGLALGNAYGSNIANIGLILGLTALFRPIAVHSQVLHKELPMLTIITFLVVGILWNRELDRLDALILLAVFLGIMGWAIVQGLRHRVDALARETDAQLAHNRMPLRHAVFWLLAGLVLLVLSSRMLVWGAVILAKAMGISELVIGLTVVALGTSLPELASSMVAVHKGKDDIALGNVLGSNLFNTLAVVGVAAGIHPLRVDPEVLYRDWPVMTGMTLLLYLMAYRFRDHGRIDRLEGAVLLAGYIGYNAYLVLTTVLK